VTSAQGTVRSADGTLISFERSGSGPVVMIDPAQTEPRRHLAECS
jgi:hypothetical protein